LAFRSLQRFKDNYISARRQQIRSRRQITLCADFSKRLAGQAFSDEDKNRRQPPRGDGESERPEIVASSLSASYSFLAPRFPSSSLLDASVERWTFTRQRSACRCAAIIAYCERKLSLGNKLSNSRTINAKFGEKATGALFNAADKSRRGKSRRAASYATRSAIPSYVESIFRSVSLRARACAIFAIRRLIARTITAAVIHTSR